LYLFEVVSGLKEYFEKLLDEAEGLLFLGSAPVGNTLEHFVWITKDFKLPFEVLELKEIWCDTKGETILSEGTDFTISAQTVNIKDLSKVRQVGDLCILYIPKAVVKDDRLWRTYGKKLMNFYSKDSEFYRLLLLSLLRLFVLGPTKDAYSSYYSATSLGITSIEDFLTKPYWWQDGSVVLPSWVSEGNVDYDNNYKDVVFRKLFLLNVDWGLFSVYYEQNPKLWDFFFRSILEGRYLDSYPYIHFSANFDNLSKNVFGVMILEDYPIFEEHAQSVSLDNDGAQGFVMLDDYNAVFST